jgi:hypothetical protein
MLPAGFGVLAALYLRPVLLRVLADLCCGEDRAEFWTRMATLGMLIGPTALSLMQAGHWDPMTDRVELIRALLSVSLNGVLLVLSVLALAMWRRIPRGGICAVKEPQA